jgi:hypothetical protein
MKRVITKKKLNGALERARILDPIEIAGGRRPGSCDDRGCTRQPARAMRIR